MALSGEESRQRFANNIQLNQKCCGCHSHLLCTYYFSGTFEPFIFGGKRAPGQFSQSKLIGLYFCILNKRVWDSNFKILLGRWTSVFSLHMVKPNKNGWWCVVHFLKFSLWGILQTVFIWLVYDRHLVKLQFLMLCLEGFSTPFKYLDVWYGFWLVSWSP